MKKKHKNNKNMLYGTDPKSNPIMCSKIKHVLRERSSELLSQKSSRSTCFFRHPHQRPAEIFFKANKRKYGDKTNMVPRMQSMCKDMIERNQCNASKPDML
jgi:hypothetical protein